MPSARETTATMLGPGEIAAAAKAAQAASRMGRAVGRHHAASSWAIRESRGAWSRSVMP